MMRGLMLAMTAEYCNLEIALQQLETRLDIDLSQGVQLDLIGEIVGQPRPMSIQINPDEVFGFDPIVKDGGGWPSGYPPDFGWSGVTRPDRGGVWTGVDGLFVGRMIDADYRTLLRARIFANQADGTVDSIAEFLNYALHTADSRVGNTVVGQVDLVISRNISSVEETIILSIVPVAAGIRVNSIIQPT
jgi:hypothetical protein